MQCAQVNGREGGGGGWGLFVSICQCGSTQTSFFAVIVMEILTNPDRVTYKKPSIVLGKIHCYF